MSRLTWTASLGMASALALSACGGGGSGAGGGGSGGGMSTTTSTTNTTSTTDTTSTSSTTTSSTTTSSTTSTSSTTTTGTGGAAGDGFTVVANGSPKSMPFVSFMSAGPKAGVFTTSAASNPAMTMVIDDVTAVGDHPCGAVTQIGYTEYMGATPTTYQSTLSGGTCLITLSAVPTQPGERWMGTFTATLPQQGGSGTMALTAGTINIKY